LLINSSSINNLKNKIKYGKTLVKLVALNLKYKFWDILDSSLEFIFCGGIGIFIVYKIKLRTLFIF
jgi:hypothetical protein